MKIRSFLFLILLFITFFLSFTKAQDGFNTRANIILDYAADHYQLPTPNYMDPEKAYWPAAIARFSKYGAQDSLANELVNMKVFRERLPFHFILVGMARLMPLHEQSPALQQHKLQYLSNVASQTNSYNPWTSEGTENHVNMSRTSGYIFAELMEEYPDKFPQAKVWKQQMKDWITYYSNKIYEVGTGEFNASTYGIFNIIGWLNLYDFAKDPDVKQMARAVLDYYAAELALHYTQGMTGGSESRGAPQTKAIIAETDYLSWLWFGDAPFDVSKHILKKKTNKDPLQAVHAATSTYRPPEAIVDFANSKFSTKGYYKNSKPAYLLNDPSYIKQFFYVDEDYTLGSAIYPYGAFASSTYKNVTWKMISRVSPGEGQHPQMVTGGGMYYADRTGKMRNPWLQVAQHKNVLIQANLMPIHANVIVDSVKSMYPVWDSLWKNDFIKRFSAKDVKVTNKHLNPVNFQSGGEASEKGNGCYIFFSSGEIIKKNKHAALLELEKVYVVVHALESGTFNIDKNTITHTVPLGKISAIAIEILDKNTSSSESIDLNQNRLNIIDQSDNTIQYNSLNKEKIAMNYSESGTFTEPVYDWGFGPEEALVVHTSPPFIQPEWPSGMGHGRVPTISVDNKMVNMDTIWPVYNGPGFTLNGKILKIYTEKYIYEVDYSGSLPKFVE